MDKIINSVCICTKRLSYKKGLVVILPCQHLIHSICCKYINNLKCPYCNKNIKNIRTHSEIYNIAKETGDKMYRQIYIDMTTVKNISIKPINWVPLLKGSIGLLDDIGMLFASDNINGLNKVVLNLLNNCNINIIVKNKHKIIPDKKIIIANHCNIIDSMMIYHVFRCGFLSSTALKETWMGKKIYDIFPIVSIKRNTSINTIEKIKNYIKDKGDICIFPEGLITHPKTLIRFRTGAFNLGYPVQPVVVSFDPYIHDNDAANFIMKLYSLDKITVTMKILDPVYPPFTNYDIEKIRNDMAMTNDMALSRISNRDIVDK